MIFQYSLLIDTNLKAESGELLKKIYDLLLPTVDSDIKKYLLAHTVERFYNDKKVNYRFIENFINNTKSLEVFLDEEPDPSIIHIIKTTLKPVLEITGYRMMKTNTKIRVQIESV